MRSLLKGISNILFAIAVALFFFGGLAISAFTRMGRVNAEVLGIGLAVVFALFGTVARRAADNLDDGDPSALH